MSTPTPASSSTPITFPVPTVTTHMSTVETVGLAIFLILMIAGVSLIVYSKVHNRRGGKGHEPKIGVQGEFAEQKVADLQSQLAKEKREKERYMTANARMQEKQLEEDIRREAAKSIQAIIPEEFSMVEPKNQWRGRPVYMLDGVPVLDIEAELQSMVEKKRFLQSFYAKWYRFKHFGYSTLFFWTAEPMSDGKWHIIVTSKPAKYTDKKVKQRWGSKEYLIEPAAQGKIESLISNSYAVRKSQAALMLTCTFLGPVALEDYAKLHGAYSNRWLSPEELSMEEPSN